MNRRSFLAAILKAGVGAAILPAATTYARRWVRGRGDLLYTFELLPDVNQYGDLSMAVDTSFECIIIPPPHPIVLRTQTYVLDLGRIRILENFSEPL